MQRMLEFANPVLSSLTLKVSIAMQTVQVSRRRSASSSVCVRSGSFAKPAPFSLWVRCSTPVQLISPLRLAYESAWICSLKLYDSDRQPTEYGQRPGMSTTTNSGGKARMKLKSRRRAEEAVEFAQAHRPQSWHPAKLRTKHTPGRSGEEQKRGQP